MKVITYYVEFNHKEYMCSQGVEITCLDSDKEELIRSAEVDYINHLITYSLPLSYTKEINLQCER